MTRDEFAADTTWNPARQADPDLVRRVFETLVDTPPAVRWRSVWHVGEAMWDRLLHAEASDGKTLAVPGWPAVGVEASLCGLPMRRDYANPDRLTLDPEEQA